VNPLVPLTPHRSGTSERDVAGSGGGHGDLHGGAELLDLFGQSRDLMFTAAPSCDPVDAEILIANVSSDDVPVGDQDVVADRADGFEGAAASSDGVIPRTQIGVFGACGGLCRLGEHRLERDRSVAGAS